MTIEEIESLLSVPVAKPETVSSVADAHASLEAVFGIKYAGSNGSSAVPATKQLSSQSAASSSSSVESTDTVLDTCTSETLYGSIFESIGMHPANMGMNKLPTSDAEATPRPFTVQYTEKEKRERKYECQHCKKRFSRPSSLTSHVYTHTGERPFACDFPGCTKRFSVLSNLRRHHKVHTNRRQPGRGRARGASTLFMARDMGLTAELAPTGSLLLSGPGPANAGTYSALGWNTQISSVPATPLQHGHAYTPMSTGYPVHQQLGYAPSVRATALAQPAQPRTHAFGVAATNTASTAFSQSFDGLPLLASIANNTPIPPHPAPVLLDAASNYSSPESHQPLRLANTALPHRSYGVGHAPPVDNPGQGFSTAHIEAILGTSTTAYSGDSDSSSSSDNALGADSWPQSLGHTRLQLGGMVRNATSPSIATPAILTNASVTTKAMSGSIESQNRASCDADALLALEQQKPAFADVASMVQANGSANPAAGVNDAATRALLDSLARGGSDGSTRIDGVSDPVWELLQAGSSRGP
ncbi:hypothetical protein IWW54_004090 [Coemansia sp. RSA 2705]|nr:hypothetical protein IWW54_004090 [Coemansia sp. RSA 2705]